MYYSYENFLNDCKILKNKIDSSGYRPDGILCVARGGMSLSHILSIAWDIRNMYSINAISYNEKTQHDLVLGHLPKFNDDLKEILILDEIVDSGKSLKTILDRLRLEYLKINFTSACIFQKPSAIVKADFYVRETQEWIDFYWEVDMK